MRRRLLGCDHAAVILPKATWCHFVLSTLLLLRATGIEIPLKVPSPTHGSHLTHVWPIRLSLLDHQIWSWGEVYLLWYLVSQICPGSCSLSIITIFRRRQSKIPNTILMNELNLRVTRLNATSGIRAPYDSTALHKYRFINYDRHMEFWGMQRIEGKRPPSPLLCFLYLLIKRSRSIQISCDDV